MKLSQLIYQNSPEYMQNIICSAVGYRINHSRYNKNFWSALRLYESLAKLPHEQLVNYRDERLKHFLIHSQNTVPYYRDLFNKIGFNATDFESLEDLKALPILNKQTIKDNPKAFQSSIIPKNQVVTIHTSGTTGSGLIFNTTQQAIHEQWATWWRHWKFHGIPFGTWCGYFGGREIVPQTKNYGRYWRINHPGKQILFSAYHLSESTAKEYVAELYRRRPPWIHGYPSMLSLLASNMIEFKFNLNYKVKWITVGAENLLYNQSKLIQEAFGIPPIQHYGMAEAVANASSNNKDTLSVDEDFSAVEFISAPNTSSLKIIGTNFTNYATPMILYDTNDLAFVKDSHTNTLSNSRIIDSIDGRLEDYIITKDLKLLGRLDHIFKDFTEIKECQIIQTKPGIIDIMVVPGNEFSEDTIAKIQSEFSLRIGNTLDINVIQVRKITKTKSGKLRFVISDISKTNMNTKSEKN